MITPFANRLTISPLYWIFISPSEFNLLTVIMDIAPGQPQDSVHYFLSNMQIFHMSAELSITKERMSTHASYNHPARRSHALHVHYAATTRESFMPRMCPSRYWDGGFARHLQRGC